MTARRQVRDLAADAYDAVSARHGSTTRWATTTDRRQAGVLLIAAMVDLAETTSTLEGIAPWRIAAAGMDASVRLGLAGSGWGDLEPGLIHDLDRGELSTAQVQWLEVVEELLELVRATPAGES